MSRRGLHSRLLRSDLMRTKNAIYEQYQAEQEQAKKEGLWGSMGGTLGGLAGQFGTPALLGLLGIATGGLGPGVLLALSAAGAAAGSYLGSKAGEELTPGELDARNIKGAEGINIGAKIKDKYQKDIINIEKEQEKNRQIGALKAGASVGAQGLSMGVDKYATYVQNPLGHYIPSMRSKEQIMYASQDAVKGLAPGTAEYDAALQSTGVDLFRPSGTSAPQITSQPLVLAPESLLDVLPSPDITTTRLPREAVNFAPSSEVAGGETFYDNLLDSMINSSDWGSLMNPSNKYK
jgi:hypothetical protein